jgi:hypothetical protein
VHHAGAADAVVFRASVPSGGAAGETPSIELQPSSDAAVLAHKDKFYAASVGAAGPARCRSAPPRARAAHRAVSAQQRQAARLSVTPVP